MANKGFTLIEMMITVAIAALLLTVAIPSFEALITNNRLSTQANAFVGALQLARSEAIKRNLNVTVCKSGDGQNCSGNANGFEQGWIVFADQQNFGTRDNGEEIINTNQGMPQGMSLICSHAAISYRADGTLFPVNNITLRLCKQGNNNGRNIVINIIGRVRVEVRNDCPIN